MDKELEWHFNEVTFRYESKCGLYLIKCNGRNLNNKCMGFTWYRRWPYIRLHNEDVGGFDIAKQQANNDYREVLLNLEKILAKTQEKNNE